MSKVDGYTRCDRRRLQLLVLGLLVVLAPGVAQSPSTDSATRVLSIGNSLTYWNDLPGQVAAIAKDLSIVPGLATSSVVAGGVDLAYHLKSPQTLDKIGEGGWSVIVLQDLDTILKDYDRSLAAASGLCREAKLVGAQVVFYEFWGWGDDGLYYVQPASRAWIGSDYFEMQARLREAHDRIAIATGTRVVPVGDAWERIRRTHPEITLHAPDSFHPTACGTYLSACVFVAALTGRDPKDTTWLPKSGVAEEEAAILRAVAWDTVPLLTPGQWSDRAGDGQLCHLRCRFGCC